MKLLIIGGTQFLGRHYVETALERGYEVTLFHRGKTNPHLFPECEHIHGDRDGEIEKLGERHWDIVVDPSGYVPRIVERSVDHLAGKCKYYVFISSLSVYPDHEPYADESAPLAVLEEPGSEEVMKHYGALKAECEQVVIERFPGNSQIVRAGMIVGPYDKINRLSYWLRRVNEGGEVLAPGDPLAPLQIVDARDIAEWSLALADRSISGIFNVTGPERPLTMQDLLETVVREVNQEASLRWVDSDFLISKEIGVIDGLPYWVTPDYYGFFQRNIDRALESGIRFRPLSVTVRDTWEELRSRGDAQTSFSKKLSLEEEQALLREFAALNEKSPSV
ncbi:MAG TPA: NAD-dependent epimerase/dehydratase family protein [Candidatus Kapabacteria bacterium]|nr:NAD-dependent epimerase/dehydratase family protein [Candidatus Kapabacteria bacterium]